MSILQRAGDERDALVERVSELEAAISAAVNRLEEGYPTEAIAILRAPTFISGSIDGSTDAPAG